jgi:hypothetical protein
MGDPVSAGVVGSVVAPTAVANPITGALATGMGGGSLFGFDPTIGGIGQGIWSGIKDIGAFTKEYPMVASAGFNAAGSLLSPQQQRMSGVGASVRQGGQIQPVDYMSLLNPQQQTVIRPATPSLI